MNIYDYVFLAIVSSSTIGGLLFGLIKSLSKFFCLFAPFMISYVGSDFIRNELIKRFNFYSGYGSEFFASLLIYIILYFLLKLLFFLIESILISLNMGLANKILGLFIGLITGSFLGYLFLILVFKISGRESLIYFKIQNYLAVFLNI